MENAERYDRLDTMIADGRLLRQRWTGEDAEGRETACLLAALSPEVGIGRDPNACPAGLMPSWLAHLTPWIDDSTSLKAWPGIIKRYASLARRWHLIDEENWRRLNYRTGAIIVREAKSHTKNERAIGVCDRVLELLDKAANGEVVTREQLREAEAEAEAEAEVAGAWAARAAARAGAGGAWAARAAAAAAAWGGARAADRIAIAVLDAIEAVVTTLEEKGGCATA